MEQVLKPVNRKDDNSRTIRNSQDYANRFQRQRKPSYLDGVKREFLQMLGEQRFEALWDFVSQEIRQSYWNGVSNGASGKVKPKTESR